MKPILVDNNYVCDHLSAGIYLFTFLNLPPLKSVLKNILKEYPQKKTLCFNLSPCELNLSQVTTDVTETHKFNTSSEIINEIREFEKQENSEFVIINSYSLLDAQEKWFLNNLLDVSCRFNLKIIILESVPTHEKHTVPTRSKIKKLLNIPYNYSNKVYYISYGKDGVNYQNIDVCDYGIYVYK